MTRTPLEDAEKAIEEFFKDAREENLDALVSNYYLLGEDEKLNLFTMIAGYSFSYTDFQKITNSLLEGEGRASDWQERLKATRDRLISPREKFFKSFVNIRGGLKFLLDMRGDLLRLGRRSEGFDWRQIDQDIVFPLDMWFMEGFLYLSEIGLDTPYRQISFIKEHDMVHPMTSVEDMVRRLGKDRLCYALYHILLPHEPVIFIEAALTDGVVGSIKEIMDVSISNEKPDTAIFYSINNTQQGLAGLGLGRLLIAKVVEEISDKYTHIKNFATLSPIPGLWNRYVEPLLMGHGTDFRMKRERLEGYFSEKDKETIISHYVTQGGKEEDFLKTLHEILSDVRWIEDQRYVEHLGGPLKKIVYFHLTEEKDDKGKPFDPVANFHLENGASLSLEHVRFMGNTYEYGVQESLSFMVNYVYHLHWLDHIRETLPSLWAKIKSVLPSKMA